MLRRQANIIVENHTNTKWEALKAAFSSGTSETCLPDEVLSNGSLQFLAVQRSFSIFTGTAGVFTYSMLDEQSEHGKTLAVMWDVPFDYNIWRSNRWNIKVMNEKQKLATRELFWIMRSGREQPVKGDELDGWKTKRTNGFIVKGCMTSNSNSKLVIKVFNDTGTRLHGFTVNSNNVCADDVNSISPTTSCDTSMMYNLDD